MKQLPLDIRILQNLVEGIATLHSHVGNVVKKIGEVNQRMLLFTSTLESLSDVASELSQELPPAQVPKPSVAQTKTNVDLECTEDDFL